MVFTNLRKYAIAIALACASPLAAQTDYQPVQDQFIAALADPTATSGTGAQLYDVTHLPCRASNFTQDLTGVACSPANAPQPAFPIATGTPMPPVVGCLKQDYSVLFVIGVSP